MSRSALIRFSQSPCGIACALKTFASSSFVPICTTRSQLGALHSYLSPQILSNRYPPKTFLQRKTVAMQADVRQCNSSTSTNWRNDSPQEVRAFSQCFPYMPNRPASFTTFSLPSQDERQKPLLQLRTEFSHRLTEQFL